MITALEHVGLSVADLDRSIAFYRDVLGFSVVRTLEVPPSLRLGDVVGLPPCTARIAHLTLGAAMLELFEYRDPVGRPIAADWTHADHGFNHIGLTSTDTRGDHARLRGQGIRFIGEPVEFRPGVWIVYFYGPDGEICELRQT
jgi:catechol 2,3-dioxygenase-like lactoylglutathione lyase family enzyme